MRTVLTLGLLLILQTHLTAQRIPVLHQIDLPHNYYYHELYLPQLTSGPSAAAWTPEGKSLIVSMGGSLWLQHLSTGDATQLTDDLGYDYQPDVSPDGKRVLFVRYSGEAMDIMLLNLEEKKSYLLTDGKSVNLEPRWSKDGSQIVFVSTQASGHFLLHTATVEGNQLTNSKVLIADRKTDAKRYYYSAFDHAINPAWAPDGKSIYFVSNHDVAHGTGNLSSVALATGEIKTIQVEETSWRMRPDISPDGTRVVYSSYLGQNWHQLWILPVEGGYPVPLTYGDFDKTAPRWSPDGKKIAYVSNKDGNTSLFVMDVFSGKHDEVKATKMNYLRQRVRLTLQLTDAESKPIAARISIIDSKGKFYAPQDVLVHADDSRVNPKRFEAHYFHATGTTSLLLPRDTFNIVATHGPLYNITTVKADMRRVDAATLPVKLTSLATPAGFGTWWSGDVHVHMNYGGNYHVVPDRLVQQAEAEDLQFVFNLIVNKEQRFPDVERFSPAPDKASTSKVVMLYGQEFHTSNWGHLGLLNLNSHLILPGYSAYPRTGVASLYPHNTFIADRAHEQQALVGYVHPYEMSDIFPDQSSTMSHALPVDAALGKVDYIEVVGFADPIATATVWYHLLNAGIRIPAAAGTDAMSNYASLRGPVGLNRVYVRGNGTLNTHAFLEGLGKGRSFVTNGPVVGLFVNDASPGDSINVGVKGGTVSYKAFLRSNTPVDRVEVVLNGEVVASHAMGPTKTLDVEGKLKIKEAGWVLLRAYNTTALPDIFDLYPYATTNPIFIGGPVTSAKAKTSGAYFLKWLDRLEKMTEASTTFRDNAERSMVLDDIRKAKSRYQLLIPAVSKK